MKNASKRQTLFAGLAAALLLSSSMTAVSVVVSRTAKADFDSEAASVDAFFKYGYGACDADVLSAFWGIDYWEAKVRGGEKVQRGEHRVLSDMLADAYAGHSCQESSSLGYDDSTAVAALWTKPFQA